VKEKLLVFLTERCISGVDVIID